MIILGLGTVVLFVDSIASLYCVAELVEALLFIKAITLSVPQSPEWARTLGPKPNQQWARYGPNLRSPTQPTGFNGFDRYLVIAIQYCILTLLLAL